MTFYCWNSGTPVASRVALQLGDFDPRFRCGLEASNLECLYQWLLVFSWVFVALKPTAWPQGLEK